VAQVLALKKFIMDFVQNMVDKGLLKEENQQMIEKHNFELIK